MKVYVVTQGCYSDYGIVAMFSTKEKAVELRDMIVGNDIEEWEVDAPLPETPNRPAGRWAYSLIMTHGGECRSGPDRESVINFTCGWQPTYNNSVYFFVWATDKVHAIKIANEQRIQLIAQDKWIADHDAWREKKYKMLGQSGFSWNEPLLS